MKTVLITGGSRGIGAACVRKYAEAGYYVAFTYNESEVEAETLANETGAQKYHCDMASPNQVKDAVNKVRDDFAKRTGRDVDILISNAGISLQGLIQDIKVDEWQRLSGVNLTGAVNVIREVSQAMVSEKNGSIVLVSSILGRSGASYEAAYSATKAGLIGLGQGLAKELGPSGIRVNMVAPGVIDTDMNRCLSKDDIDEVTNDIALGRIGKPSEVADLIFFLTSDNASYITGQTIGIDGGFVI